MMLPKQPFKVPYFSIDNAHPKLMYTAVYRACSFFTNLDLFCIDNALPIEKYGTCFVNIFF